MKGSISEQLYLEREARDIKEQKEFRDLNKAIVQGRFDETMYGSAIMKTYYLPIRDKLQEYLDTKFLGHTAKTQRYILYLCDDVDKLAYVVLQSLVKQLAKKNNRVKIVSMSGFIADNLRIVQTFDTAEKTNPKLISYLGHEYKRASVRRRQELMEKHLIEFVDSSITKVRSMDIKAGSTLIEVVKASGCNLIDIKKLFKKGVDRYSTLYIQFTEEVLDVLQSTYYIPPTVALYPPMVIAPKPWTDYKKGGYLSVDNTIIKPKSKKSNNFLRTQDYSKILPVINKLQETGWRVNKRISNIIYDIYKDNMIDPRSPPTLPYLYGGIPTSIPTKVEDLMDGFGNYSENPTPEEKKAWAIWNKKREKIKIGLDGEQGRRLQYLMTMGVVDKMIDYDEFYYVYQLDYRGRVYPITDFLNPQSKGYVKAMLEFSEGEYLNDTGIYWLKVHSANTYGLDKAPFEERIKWAEDNRDSMLEAAEDPMSNLGYWTSADSPFEFLASCMALQDHVYGKKVHLPIQLDAVNSGIQMYSGLLRDRTGAESTCVVGDTRSDLYREVADRVEKKLREGKYPPYITFMDKEGVEKVLHTKTEAESMIGNFTRSMTKRNVMTIPYSVSLRGMKMQNWDVMDDLRLTGKAFWKGDDWIVNYLWTTLVYESVYEIVKGARAGQEYLKDVVRLLKEPAQWFTPIYNLPVYQGLFKSKEMRVKTVLGTLSLLELSNEPKKQKQMASVAANFIHSIDATILLYVVEHISGDIGTIHDCFLVHPNLGEEVRDKYKEGYVEVMKADPLKMFSKQLDPDGKVEIPYINDLDLEDVYDSEYIIS
jgi:DNA-directed RNA polymerase